MKAKIAGRQKAALFRGGKKIEVEGGLDFSEAVFDESLGKRCSVFVIIIIVVIVIIIMIRCIVKEEETDAFEKKPILECTHK